MTNFFFFEDFDGCEHYLATSHIVDLKIVHKDTETDYFLTDTFGHIFSLPEYYANRLIELIAK